MVKKYLMTNKSKTISALRQFYGKIDAFNYVFTTDFTSYNDIIRSVLTGKWWNENLEQFFVNDKKKGKIIKKILKLQEKIENLQEAL